jgi:hypothetical protein
MDTQPLLKEACSAVFGNASGLVDMLVQHVPSSKKATAKKVQQDFTGVCSERHDHGVQARVCHGLQAACAFAIPA